ncbi:TPA: hypothetical protein RF372_000484 [Listeria monocytogenes]|uniref:Lin1261 protein n=1 Tax=Listeria innocua serovar 6a (strain ATCC BAA-680 / CLIP 11262) TaxID=272626 RepID=Q92CC7_LISIN|nr:MULTISPECIES: hypothetical protein [Listeria]HDM9181232.1 hypothetical protein [Listeria innocua]EAE5608357.1 hypothetical protein [Listeria monocytogenes]EAG8854343.1 hypothetical protein [Listeria monocytogenes]EAG8943955.1 hypothetical protein [Listeria monocytogenes]EAG8961631.1 hypothetical protein [Listeria monocytogenes]
MEVGSLAEWVSGIGTLLAVGTSLYLANRNPKKKLLVSHEIKEIGTLATVSDYNIETLVVTVANLEITSVQIRDLFFVSESIRIKLPLSALVGFAAMGKTTPCVVDPFSEVRFLVIYNDFQSLLKEKNARGIITGEILVVDESNKKHRDKVKLTIEVVDM